MGRVVTDVPCSSSCVLCPAVLSRVGAGPRGEPAVLELHLVQGTLALFLSPHLGKLWLLHTQDFQRLVLEPRNLGV